MTNKTMLLLALACLTTILGFEAGRRFERKIHPAEPRVHLSEATPEVFSL